MYETQFMSVIFLFRVLFAKHANNSDHDDDDEDDNTKSILSATSLKRDNCKLRIHQDNFGKKRLSIADG